ncbi:hypothetical protein Enr13x_71910 [Stieleria neptunia]|uniref:Uncharacterized protein n=1 Tax=Stieleria neptunia TaxID=2527979 RepID=A0A518I2E2_9BACT|nr:hypothetical protein [Stieleria neptunia]QDV47282.1 hypothetical protein Enr13x_71910 [Stieleria neptunia]
MKPNPYEPQHHAIPDASAETLATRFWTRRPAFLSFVFITTVSAYYGGLTENALSTPYLQPHLGFGFFWGFLDGGLILAAIVTGAVALCTAFVKRFALHHYGFVIAISFLVFSLSWYFFVAFFGI